MGTTLVGIVGPVGDLRAGMIEAMEKTFVGSSSRIRPLKLSQKPFCIGSHPHQSPPAL
jgi:hypothetical protein